MQTIFLVVEGFGLILLVYLLGFVRGAEWRGRRRLRVKVTNEGGCSPLAQRQ